MEEVIVKYLGKEYKVKKDLTIHEFLLTNNLLNDSIIAVYVFNEVKSLNHIIDKNIEISPITTKETDGRHIYIRGLLYILSMAIDSIYPENNMVIEYQLSNSMYVTLDGVKITNELLKKITEKMQEIILAEIDIKKVVMSKKEAEAFYTKHQTVRGILQKQFKEKDQVTLYFAKDYFNYFYGVMPVNTKYCRVFELQKHTNGFIIKYPQEGTNFDKVGEFVQTKKLQKALQEYNEIYNILGISTIEELNNKILTNPIDLVLLSEALHEKKISDLSKKIRKQDDVRMILIAGPSSSGKTTFAGKLSTSLRISGIKPVTISVDNYFVDRDDTPKDEKGNFDFESINAIDLKLFNKHLEELLQGKEIEMPTYNFKKGCREFLGNTLKLEENEILIIEGIHCLNDELTSKIPKENKFKIYISALTTLNIDYFNRISTTDTRLIRRIIRDFNTRNYSATHTLGMWYSVRRGEKRNIFPFQEEADFIFNSSVIYEIAVLKKHIVPLLKEISPHQKEYSEAKRILGLLQYFEDIPDELVPNNSLIREFLGNSLYEI